MTKKHTHPQKIKPKKVVPPQADMLANMAGGNEVLSNAISTSQNSWQRRANKRTKIITLLLFVFGLVGYISLVLPPKNFPVNQLVTVQKDQGFASIAHSLENQQVVSNAFAAKIIAKMYGADRSVHSGDYIFKESANIFEVIKRLKSGSFGLDPVVVRVREGSTITDIAESLEGTLLRFDTQKFLAAAAQSEGYLYPDTYHFLPNISETQIVAAMVDNFHKNYNEVLASIGGEASKESQKLTKQEIITLASIVELEAWKYQDRRKIAGVMYNRLAINMPLQVDVSFVYIMNKGTFDITRKDLKHSSPYNTYKYKGLPPGPICSPSKASLRAVLNPVKSDWIFYLADSGGTTHFTKTYAQHLAKKRRYIDNR